MYADATAILRAFFNMCLLRHRPQDLPASRELLLACAGVYFLLSFLLAELNGGVTNALLSGLIDTGFLLLFSYLLLLLYHKANRWPQTVTALTGAGAMLSVLLVPVFIPMAGPEPSPETESIFRLLFYVMGIWYIAVMAHIFRHALSSSFAFGIFISIVYLLMSFIIGVVTVYPAL